jgi:hypothetical protein
MAPNGAWMAIPSRERLYLLSADGKSEKTLSSKPGWQAVAWTKDSARVYALRGEAGNFTLESVDLTGKSTTVNQFELRFGENLRGLTISPDGKSVTTAKTRFESDLWVLEGFNGGR